MPEATDEPAEPAEPAGQQTLVDLLGPALDRSSALADQLAHLLIGPR
ncbi:hypothetical protein [Labedaea rhizosphaerae]|uniref:Uncharacterized protein n=1 Tax=Labedaea rhizosphaerae TaxID=598644 RepID=A0A4R6SMH3_LABRH|nr:hypothetical protein [Labedaea rhizosphaerae]TDQ05488.1 hypothetical protein EV186_1011459 [Labedaea rhizosphaerae]